MQKTVAVKTNDNKKSENNPQSFQKNSVRRFSNNPILSLQQTVGNKGVQNLIKLFGIYPKLKISNPSDKHEKEADKISYQVLKNTFISRKNLIHGSTLLSKNLRLTKNKTIHRRCSNCNVSKENKEIDYEEKKLKTKKINRKSWDTSNSIVTDNVSMKIQNSISSNGFPIDSNNLDFMEQRFGYDFSNVRIHNDTKATESAKLIKAKAYTLGRDVVFDHGEYRPNTESGRLLLAHELYHVIQHNEEIHPKISRFPNEDEEGVNQTGKNQERSTNSSLGSLEEETPVRPSSDNWFSFRGFVVTDDREFMRGEIRRLFSQKGRNGARYWRQILVERQGRPGGGMNLPFSAHARAFGGLRVRSPLDAVRDQQQENFRQAAATNGIPTTLSVFREVDNEATEYLQTFENLARSITLNLLRQSEIRIETERDRYGIKRKRGRRGGHRYEIRNNNDTRDLINAANELRIKNNSIERLRSRRDRLVMRRVIRNIQEYNRLDRMLNEEMGQFEILKNNYRSRYPILNDFLDSPRRIRQIAQSRYRDGILGSVIFEKLNDIEKVRKELIPGGEVKIWKLSKIVEVTKVVTHANRGTSLGSMRLRLVDDKVQQVLDDEFWTSLAIGVLAIGLGLLAAIPTGGTSLLAAGTAFGLNLAALAVDLYIVSDAISRYSSASSLTNTDFEKANALSQEEPSLFWLAVDIVGAGMSGASATRAFREMVLLRNSIRNNRNLQQLQATLTRLDELAMEGGNGIDQNSVQRILGRSEENLATRTIREIETNSQLTRFSNDEEFLRFTRTKRSALTPEEANHELELAMRNGRIREYSNLNSEFDLEIIYNGGHRWQRHRRTNLWCRHSNGQSCYIIPSVVQPFLGQINAVRADPLIAPLLNLPGVNGDLSRLTGLRILQGGISNTVLVERLRFAMRVLNDQAPGLSQRILQTEGIEDFFKSVVTNQNLRTFHGFEFEIEGLAAQLRQYPNNQFRFQQSLNNKLGPDLIRFENNGFAIIQYKSFRSTGNVIRSLTEQLQSDLGRLYRQGFNIPGSGGQGLASFNGVIEMEVNLSRLNARDLGMSIAQLEVRLQDRLTTYLRNLARDDDIFSINGAPYQVRVNVR